MRHFYPELHDRRSRRSGTPMVMLVVVALIGLASARFAPAGDFYLEAAGGLTHFYRIHRDNYWYQERYPYSHDVDASAWRLGIGKKLNDNWAATLSWVDLGKNGVRSTVILNDPVYSNCLNGDSGPNGCGYPKTNIHIVNENYGPEIAFRRSFDWFYLRGGMMVWFTKQYHEGYPAFGRGTMYAPMLGAGLQYKWLFLDASYYHVAINTGRQENFPIAKQALVPMIGFRVPFK
jgi:hypothetical protein